jgi:ABC-type lipoprotein export system ATPase subunit
MLKLNDVTKTYTSAAETVTAMDSVSFEIRPGELVVIRGPSGCGKSTLLLTAGGLLSPTTGTVEIDGREPYRLTPGERAGLRAKTVGFVFQQFHLIPYLSVLENVMTPMLAGGPCKQKLAEELIDKVGLTPRNTHRPSQLSTGEKQRTAIARALLNDPKLILADEPTGNLDECNRELVLKALRSIAEEGRAVMMVTHDSEAEKIADRVIRMSDGRIVN